MFRWARKRPEEQAAMDPLIFIYLPKHFQELPLPHVTREQGPGDRDPQRLGQLCGACFIADVLRTCTYPDNSHSGDLTDLMQLLYPGLNAPAHLPGNRDSQTVGLPCLFNPFLMKYPLSCIDHCCHNCSPRFAFQMKEGRICPFTKQKFPGSRLDSRI